MSTLSKRLLYFVVSRLLETRTGNCYRASHYCTCVTVLVKVFYFYQFCMIHKLFCKCWILYFLNKYIDNIVIVEEGKNWQHKSVNCSIEDYFTKIRLQNTVIWPMVTSGESEFWKRIIRGTYRLKKEKGWRRWNCNYLL